MSNAKTIRESLERLSTADIQTLQGIARQAYYAGDFDPKTLSLFVAPAFLELRLGFEGSGAQELIQDFEILANGSERGEEFATLRDALRLSSHILAVDPSQLCIQFLGRLPNNATGFIRELTENFKNEFPQAPHPVRKALIQSKDAFSVIPVSKSEIKSIILLPHREGMAVLDGNGLLQLLSLKNFDIIDHIKVPGCIDVCLDATGDYLRFVTESARLVTVGLDPLAQKNEVFMEFERPISIVIIDANRAVVAHMAGVSIISLHTGEELVRVGIHEGADDFHSITVLPVSGHVVAGCSDGRIDVWSSETGRFVKRVGWFGEASEKHRSRAVSMMGVLIDSGAWVADDGEAERIDFQAYVDDLQGLGEEKRRYAKRTLQKPMHEHVVTSMVVTPGGKKVIAASISGELCLWDLEEGFQPTRFDTQKKGGLALTLSKDGEFLAEVGEDFLRVWRVTEKTHICTLAITGAGPRVACFLPNNNEIVAGTKDGAIVQRQYNPNVRVVERREKLSSTRLIAPSGSGVVLDLKRGGTVEEWRADSGVRFADYQLEKEKLNVLQVDHSGRRVVGCIGDVITVYDIYNRVPMYRRKFNLSELLERHLSPAQKHAGLRNEIDWAEVSDDGTRVVVGFSKEGILGALLKGRGTLLLLNMITGEERILTEEVGLIRNHAISPKGELFCTISIWRAHNGCDTIVMRIWDLTSCQLVEEKRMTSDCGGLTFRKDGTRLLWCEGQTLMQSNARSPNYNEVLLKFPRGCAQLNLAEDDLHLVIIADDGSVELWTLETFACILKYRADYLARCSVFVPETGLLFISDDKGEMHVLDCHRTTDLEAERHRTHDKGSRPAQLLDEARTLSQSGRTGDSLDALQKLADDPKTPVILRIGLAKKLRRSGREDVADDALRRITENGEISNADRIELISYCEEFKTTAPAAVVFLKPSHNDADSRELLSQLIRAGNWILDLVGQDGLLEVIADIRIPSLHRLVAAEVLAYQGIEAGKNAMLGIARNFEIDCKTRCVAWCDLRTVIQPAKWLNGILKQLNQDGWPEDCANRMLAEIRRLISESSDLLDLEGEKGIPEIGLLRTANDWNFKAMRLASVKDFDGAIKAASQAIQQRPGGSRYYHTRGMIYLLSAKERYDLALYEVAVSDLTKAIEIDPLHEGAWAQRGYVYSELKEFELALFDISRAIDLDVNNWENYKSRSYCLEQLGRLREAAQDDETAKRLRERKYHSEEGWFGYGKCRVGDEPTSLSTEGHEIRLQVVDALRRHGLLDRIVEALEEQCRNHAGKEGISKEAILELRALEGWASLRSLIEDRAVDLSCRLDAAFALASEQRYDDAIELLVKTASDQKLEQHTRIKCVGLILDLNDVEVNLDLIKRFRDLRAPSEKDPPLGLVVLPSLLRGVLENSNSPQLLFDLASSKDNHPIVREVACELILVSVDKRCGREMLSNLQKDLDEDDPIQLMIENALAYSEQQEGPKLYLDISSKLRSMIFWKPFRLRKSNRLQESPRPSRIRMLFTSCRRCLAKIRRMTKDKSIETNSMHSDLSHYHELIDFQDFAITTSVAEMKKLVKRYPFLTTPECHEKLEEIISDTATEMEQPGLFQRLDWLRSLPPDPIQLAVQALARVGSREELLQVAKEHPVIMEKDFQKVLKANFAFDPALARSSNLLATLLESEAGPVDVAVEAAIDLLEEGRAEEALERLETIKDAPHSRGLIAMGEAYMQLGEYERALETYNKIISYRPSSLVYARRGKVFIHLNQHAAALTDFDEAIKLEANSFDALLGRGIAHSELGNFDKAMKDLTHAEILSPDDLLVHITKGVNFLAKHEYELAINAFQRSLLLDPDQPLGGMLAFALFSVGRKEEAERVLAESDLDESERRSLMDEIRHLG
jgi:tetratricopeptide (TPR) repeat protein/WD40 repeat protein